MVKASVLFSSVVGRMTVRPATPLLSLAAGLGDALEVGFFAASPLTTGERDGGTLLSESVAAERTVD